MWYLKDYQGNESGPYTLDQLLDAFQDPVLKENATLIRSGKEGLWKPAIITFPAIFAAADKVTSVNATALPASDLNLNFPPASVRNQQANDAGPDTEDELGRISAELNRVRYVIVCTILSLIFLTLVLLSLSEPYTVTGDANSLNIRNVLIASAIFMLYPLGKLGRLVISSTKPTPTSIYTTIALHRSFWSGLLTASFLSVILLIFTFLAN